ncbi:hypothetical protein [Sphingomonas sp.]|uniref:hypothetical protein n=1 Tax=Sphingomonas sp. TaxID=28214 RepID=UPI002B8315FF|nr:hypothetical protein [Sphingomonas sp.]HWK36745.1 hypothetical protein [Sphingomonas sp.]
MAGAFGKPTASLSSGLLARKGQARPAMKPQGYHTSLNLEDLGWNDMGEAPDAYPAPLPPPAPVRPLTANVAPLEDAPVPQVLAQREVLREEYPPLPPVELHAEPEAAPESAPVVETPSPVLVRPVSLATAARIRREVRTSKPKVAFTLRLDADRHLRLRLASACRNRSAQALVTEALDAFIASLPEVEPLIDQLNGSGKA